MELKENLIVADKFRLVRMIGRGGMGSVWQAQQIGLERTCAVKFIEGELANVAEAHGRFQREAQAAANLRSQHVVQIYDHGVWQGKPYIAMELLQGRDLGRRLALSETGRIALDEIHDIMQQVCKALTKAHQAGLVHRDLKPDNIFLCEDEDGSGKHLVKILDFGVAKATGQAIDGSNTKTGAMLGTPYYMSPEQAQGIKTVDARSDLWSLAVIVFQCITGRLPFESEALGDLLVKIIVNPVPLMSQMVPDVPRELDEWWKVAAERSPEKRFQTAKQFAEELNKAIASVGNITQMTSAHSNQRIPQGTAVMQHGTPPALQGQQYTQAMQTPPGQQQRPFMQTPQPYMNTPHPGQPGAYPPNATTGSGLSAFSESQGNIPKKGPPMVLIAAFAALAIVGVAATGVALKMRSTPTVASSSAAPTPPPPEATSAVPTPPPEPPPAETAAAKPPETKPAEKPPEPPPASTAVAVKLNPQPPPAFKPQPPPTAKQPTPPAKKPPEKPLNLGF